MIHIYRGSILDLEVDTIVNPANSFLRHDGGLAAVIAKAAIHGNTRGGRDWEQEQRDTPLVATGNAVATSAGHLPYRTLIHAVGPVWNGGDFYEADLLSLAYQNACALAHDEGCRSIAFPAISCGVFGYPVAWAARIALSAVAFWATPQPDGLGMEVTFALFEDSHVDAFSDQLFNPAYGKARA